MRFLDSIPRNVGGKVQIVKLRAMEHKVEGSGSGQAGENLKGKKAEDLTAQSEGSVDGATEGGKSNEKTTNGVDGDGERE